MEDIIRGIGIVILAAGVAFSTMPALMRRVMAFACVGKRVYIGAVVRLIIGVLLLTLSPHARLFWIPVVVGSLTTLTGIAIFLFGTERTHAFIAWWEAKSDAALRIIPIIASVVGILLIYAA